MTWRRRQQLIFFGYSEAEILQLGDLGKLTNERMNELIYSKSLEGTENTGQELNKTLAFQRGDSQVSGKLQVSV